MALATVYHQGLNGVQIDNDVALKWYGRAARKGVAQAQFELGLMYAKGEATEASNLKAHMWWNISNHNGYENAANNLRVVTERMNEEEIVQAQQMAQTCFDSSYQDCVE